MANYESLGYRERIGKPTPEKIAQLDHIFQRIKSEWSQILDTTKKETGKVRSNIETRVSLSNAVKGRSTDTNGLLTDLSEASKFTYINAALNRAFIQDLEGPFLQ